MSNQACALTADGYVDIETGIPLRDLRVGDTVLGLQSPDDSSAPRCKHVVTAPFGWHYVPTEDPTILEKGLRRIGLERLFAGEKREGVLVGKCQEDAEDGAAMFDTEATPVLDRVIF